MALDLDQGETPRQRARMVAMDVKTPLVLAGGLSPATFMKRHWQKKPLLVRQAWPGVSRRCHAPPSWRWLPRTTWSRASWPAKKAAGACARARCHAAPAAAAAPGLDAAGAGPGPARAGGARHAGGLSLCARRTGGRPHGVVGQPRWRRGPAHRRLRRLPDPGARPAPLARGAGRRPVAWGRRTAQAPAALRAHRKTGCWSPATCCTCRRAGRTTASPKAATA
jgi:hypothetical protein